jgi:hypothetical protein
VLTFVDIECHVVSVTDPFGRILGFLDRSRYFFFQVAPQYEAEWTPFQTYYFSENVVAPAIEPGSLDLYPGALTTRPQRRFISCKETCGDTWLGVDTGWFQFDTMVYTCHLDIAQEAYCL